MARGGYTVRLDAFEGPLDLLLHLVKSNEVDIYHLPIATITDQYLEYLDMFEELNLDVAGEYLVVAATLMYLKSRLLLPTDDSDDELPLEDTETDLVRQLAEYQRYRDAAEELRERIVLGRDVFRREPQPPRPDERDEAEIRPVDLPTLLEALRRVLSQAAARAPHQLEGDEYRVVDAVRGMVSTLRGRSRVAFEHLFAPAAPRGWIIATFVGLLELVKLGVVDAVQQRGQATIYLRLLDDGVDAKIEELVASYGHAEFEEAEPTDSVEPSRADVRDE